MAYKFAWLAMASAFTCAGLMHQKTYFTEVQTTAIWSVTGVRGSLFHD